MFRGWKFIFLIVLSVALLAACDQSLDEQVTAGIDAAEEAFHSNDKERTEEINGIKLYKPTGFTISDQSDAQNIVFKKNDETFILFINPNEESDSRLLYDLLLSDQNKETIEQKTFEDEGTFGFVAILKSDEGYVELIASVGGAKMTTVTKKKNIDEKLASMMEVVRSIK